MHSCIYVLISGPEHTTEALVAGAMAPFDEHLRLPPYKLHLSASTLTAMGQHYGLPETDLKGLAAKLPDWMGCPGGIDELGLFARLTSNPNGKWDWYEIGGRFDGHILGQQRSVKRRGAAFIERNTVPAGALLAAPDFNSRIPFAVVTPLGEWIERSTVTTTMGGWYVRQERRARWRQKVCLIPRTFSGHRVVCVDAHC